jgi:hypothetical protein
MTCLFISKRANETHATHMAGDSTAACVSVGSIVYLREGVTSGIIQWFRSAEDAQYSLVRLTISVSTKSCPPVNCMVDCDKRGSVRRRGRRLLVGCLNSAALSNTSSKDALFRSLGTNLELMTSRNL